MPGSLNQHVKTPPAAKRAHRKKHESIDPTDLLEDDRECQHTRSDCRTSHAQDRSPNTASLHFTKVALAARYLLLTFALIVVIILVIVVNRAHNILDSTLRSDIESVRTAHDQTTFDASHITIALVSLSTPGFLIFAVSTGRHMQFGLNLPAMRLILFFSIKPGSSENGLNFDHCVTFRASSSLADLAIIKVFCIIFLNHQVHTLEVKEWLSAHMSTTF